MKVLLIIGIWIVVSFLLALALGRFLKRCTEDAERTMHEPDYKGESDRLKDYS